MKPLHINLLVLFSILLPGFLFAQDDASLTEDSKPKANVPQGEIKGPFTWSSTIYPGTVREYWLYLPKQYDASKPTCSIIVQDGLNCAESWKLPTVMDNLIHKKEIPVMIGIFINWGRVEAGGENLVRFNRSFEYDGMGDRYARFLLEEIIPEVSKSYNLSKDPNDRMLAGQSSGAICALSGCGDQLTRTFVEQHESSHCSHDCRF
jgi:enterochelin esterase family protein